MSVGGRSVHRASAGGCVLAALLVACGEAPRATPQALPPPVVLPAGLQLDEAPAQVEELADLAARTSSGLEVVVRARVVQRPDAFVARRAVVSVEDARGPDCAPEDCAGGT